MKKSSAKGETIEELIILNDELENYFRNTIIPQLFVDRNLILRKFTPPAMKQFQLAESDIGMHIDEISHRIRFPTFMENIKEVIGSGEDFEKEIQTTDMRWFQMNILPYRVIKDNSTNGVIITFINITDRISNLAELQKINADHETFIYTVSHDVKGPISNLNSLFNILKDIQDKNAEDAQNVFRMMFESMSNLEKVITELTDLTKIRYNIAKGEKINIEDILHDVKLTLYDRINTSRASISLEIKAKEVTFISKNLRSIIYNLLSNAIKYKSPDRNPEITIKTFISGKYFVFSVTDNGMGIARDKKKSIFSEFSRINDDVEGTGIGLYIVNKMVKNSGGKIEVKSTLGKGTTMSVYFAR